MGPWRGHDIDVLKVKTRHGNHIKTQDKALVLCFFAVTAGCKDMFPNRCIVVNDIRTHTDHIDIHMAEKFDIAGQVIQGLPRQPHHVSGSYLVANLFERL